MEARSREVEMWPVLAFVFALLEVLAVWKEWRRLEFPARPAAILALLLWLASSCGLAGAPFWFGLGLIFSLVGDILLIGRERFLPASLLFFIPAYLADLAGFNLQPPPLSVWNLFMALVVGLGAARLLRRLLAGVHASGQPTLRILVTLHGSALTLMLLSALFTLSNTAWDAFASVLAALGAALLFLSDNLLAWNQFVAPISRTHFKYILACGLGRILLIAGVIRQFS